MLGALTKSEFVTAGKETRLVQVGESAGASIRLPAAVLRSTAITILGTAGVPPIEVLSDAMKQVLQHGSAGELRMETQRVPLADIESVWKRDGQPGSRVVVVP